MTSSTDADRHPDVSEISDLTEGLLPPSRAAELRRHLDDCPLCADVHASLEEIRGLLGTLPGAGRMPADVAGRIDAALAAEALLSATAPALRAEGAVVGRPGGQAQALKSTPPSVST
ncbi:zf-HC2 domain-containing protein, partial [Streptomyces zhihengii]